MPATIYYDNDADLGLLEGRKVAVLGYGSQGHAHALNLKDSGIDVRRRPARGLDVEGQGRRGRAAGAHRPPRRCRRPTSIMVLLPDTEQKRVYEADIEPNLVDGQLARVRARVQHPLRPDPRRPKGVDVWMIAPKGPGHLVRRTYEEGGGVPASSRCAHDATGKAKQTALAYAKGDRRHPRRRARHHVRGGDRDRPLR